MFHEAGAYNAPDAFPLQIRIGVIGTRLAAAVSLILAISALALAVAALFAALREDGSERGRLVQTRLLPSEAEPVLFPLDEFYASVGDDGRLRAFYIYPPGFHGHTRGCKVVWSAAEDVAGSAMAGAFIDPCGGARFARDGALLSGPAERGLDEFKSEPGIEGMIVDTRTLYCGAPMEIRMTATAGSPLPMVSATPPGGTVVAGATPMPTATPTATASPTPTRTPTPSGIAREECDRVSPDID